MSTGGAFAEVVDKVESSQVTASKAQFKWRYPWMIMEENEGAIANLRVARILMLRCEAAKDFYGNTSTSRELCQEAEGIWDEAEKAGMFFRYASLELLGTLKGQDGKVAKLLSQGLKQQIGDLEQYSMLWQMDNDQYLEMWGKFSAQFETDHKALKNR